MSKQKGGRKVGRNKRKPANVAYQAQDRLNKNKRRRAAMQARIESEHAAKKGAVAVKRKLGAVRRLKHRIAAGHTSLDDTLARATAALNMAKGAEK